MDLDPKEYGLPASTKLELIDQDTIALVIKRKSRLIMADGKRILEKVAKIKQVQSSVSVQLVTTAPICSKTKNVLLNQDIKVIHI